jgi:glycosyltransferase involved in cell wall biosynthesis
MGRLGPEKGFDWLIEAYAQLSATFPDWHLIIYGEGQERPRLEALIREKGLEERIRLPGIEQHPEQALPHADVFVVSSRYEGFSMVLAETMAMGLPVVSFACSGPLEIVRDGVDGLLAPPGDVAALAATLARLMRDETLRRRLAQEAVAVADRFAPERILGLWRNEIEAVCAATPTVATT